MVAFRHKKSKYAGTVPQAIANAVICIWSCEAASTYKKCAGLQAAAYDLDAKIYAKTGDVEAGPDGGPMSWIVSCVARKIEAWVVGSSSNEWRVFKPRPKIGTAGYKSGPKAYKIIKEEVKVK